MIHFNPMQVNNQYDEIDGFLAEISSAMKALIQKTLKQRKLKLPLNGYEQALSDLKVKLSKSKN